MRNFRVKRFGGGYTRVKADDHRFGPGHVAFYRGDDLVLALHNDDAVEIIEYKENHVPAQTYANRRSQCEICGRSVQEVGREWVHV